MSKGTKLVTRNDMMSYDLPQQTDTYTVISNKELIDTSLEAFYKYGYQLKREEHKSARYNNVFISIYSFTSGSGEMGMMFGHVNSYDKTKSAAYVIGSEVFICENGCIKGDEKMFRKHTGSANADIKIAIEDGVKRMADSFGEIERDFARMKEVEVSKKVAASLIGDMYLNESIIRSNQLSIIKGQMKNCSFDYGVTDSLYNVYQDCTYAFKQSHPTEYVNQHVDLHNYLTQIS